MKISLKIFIFTYCIMMVLMVAGGYFFIDSSFKSSLEQEMETAKETNEVIYTYVMTYNEMVLGDYAEYSLSNLIDGMSKNGEEILVGQWSERPQSMSLKEAEDLKSGECFTAMVQRGGNWNVLVMSRYDDDYIINYRDVSAVLRQRESNYELFQKGIVLASVVIAVVLFIFAWYVTRPIARVTGMAEQIAGGDYDVHIDDSYRKMKSIEVMKLATILNQLAENTRKHIAQLEETATRKEEFMGNFTHEIKTPLTSIIGYADLIRTYDLKPEKRRDYGNFIYNEGKRLEQLALNLLHLIILGKTDFEMKTVKADELLLRLRDATRFLGEKYHIEITFSFEKAELVAEQALLITALMNLIDNACKASKEGSVVNVVGSKMGEEYAFVVIDHGCGIAQEEIVRIMEPFYMVDKSRAREQGGAGLGLALCQKIAQIHSGEIRVTSVVGEGTQVFLIIRPGTQDSLEAIANEK